MKRTKTEQCLKLPSASRALTTCVRGLTRDSAHWCTLPARVLDWACHRGARENGPLLYCVAASFCQAPETQDSTTPC